MNKTIRLALIGASVLALTSPVLARTATRSDRMTSHSATGVGEPNTAPVMLRERAPEQMVYGWNQSAGFDRASSPLCGRRQLRVCIVKSVSLLDTACVAAGRKASRFRLPEQLFADQAKLDIRLLKAHNHAAALQERAASSTTADFRVPRGAGERS